MRVRALRLAAALSAAVLCGSALLCAPARAQEAHAATAATADTVTVGDRFQVAVRVSAPRGSRVEFPAHPDSAPDAQALGAVRVRRDPARGEHTAVYTLVAWRTGQPELPPLRVVVTLPDARVETLQVEAALPFVRSVLPADTAGVEPRGPKDVLDPRRSLWPWLAAAAAVLLLALLLHRLRRRRPAPPEAPPAPADPRALALAALERARSLGLVEAREWKEFHALTSGALRGLVAALSPRWGTELTTRELLRRMGEAGAPAEEVVRLGALLREADLVKFARARPTAEEAERHWREARAWVERFEPRRRPAGRRAEAAG